MNIEAVQKAYTALERDGIVKNPKKAFKASAYASPEEKERNVVFASDKCSTLINMLCRELEFPPICYTYEGRTFPTIVVYLAKNLPDARKSIAEKAINLAELFETARCFV